MKIVKRGRIRGLTYWEVICGDEIIAAIWKRDRAGEDRYSIATPEKSVPRVFASMGLAKRWLLHLRS